MNDIIDVAISFVISILSGLGVGSGGLLMIWLSEVRSFPADEARSINLIFFIFSAGAALLLHIRKRKFYPSLVSPVMIFAIIGSLVGTAVGTFLPSEVTRRAFGIFLLLSGIYTLASRSAGHHAPKKQKGDAFEANLPSQAHKIFRHKNFTNS